MNRRSLFKRVAATIAVAALTPVVKLVAPEALSSVSTYDTILKNVYGPAIIDQLRRETIIIPPWIDPDGTVLHWGPVQRGFVGVYRWIEGEKEVLRAQTERPY